ncbi:MAG: CCA tRNA nucleotidyltransferase [Afipia sp. 62-7]|nr:CCA tRNA nucleotidyltransferase [Afipia sp.]OJU21525.1 MAG: CCA tRNA nucleotidyltransferase [Afipia sp. 62-7]
MSGAASSRDAPFLRGAAWLTSGGAARVLALLNADGEEARVVGGAVRNALLGLPVGEIDIATTAHPEEVMRRAKAAHIKAVPTGVEHGTVTLVIEGEPFEVTTLREDIETFGRKAKVAFGRDWACDATRRDFTINGLSVSPDGVVHDAVGGLADIAAKRVRFIGEPSQRIAEDYLRILRFFRIHAAYGEGAPDRDGYLACIAGREGLAGLSAERIRMEMFKLVVAKGAAPALIAMDDAGLLLRLTAGVVFHGAFAGMIAVECELGLAPDPVRRLGALAVAVTEDAKRISQRWRLSNVEAKRLDSMGHRWWRLMEMDEATAQRRLYRLGVDRYRDRIMLASARAGRNAVVSHWRDLATLPDRWTAPVFPLKASDFIARGIAQGPALGHVLALAEDAWLAMRFPQDAASLKTIADDTVARFARDHRL